jgi:hypothetical protein
MLISIISTLLLNNIAAEWWGTAASQLIFLIIFEVFLYGHRHIQELRTYLVGE